MCLKSYTAYSETVLTSSRYRLIFDRTIYWQTTSGRWSVQKTAENNKWTNFLSISLTKEKTAWTTELIKCLQLSLEHSGHQDLLAALKQLVEKQTADPIADAPVDNDDQDSAQVRP